MEFKIYRSQWKRGNDRNDGASRLLNDKGKYDILGFYALAKGFTPSQLLDRYYLQNLFYTQSFVQIEVVLESNFGLTIPQQGRIVAINDSGIYKSDQDREAELTRAFAENNITIHFYNSPETEEQEIAEELKLLAEQPNLEAMEQSNG